MGEYYGSEGPWAPGDPARAPAVDRRRTVRNLVALAAIVVLSGAVWALNRGLARIGRPSSELLAACQVRDLPRIREILQRGGDVDERHPRFGGCLHLLLQGRATRSELMLLLGSGADPDLRDGWGSTPLHVAARTGQLDLVELLLDHGADADAGTADGLSVLADAISSTAGVPERVRIARRLLEEGADPDAGRSDGHTALMAAVGTGQPELVEVLLEAGADVNRMTWRREEGEPPWSALRLARHHGFRRITTLLLDAGAVEPDPAYAATIARRPPRPSRTPPPGVDGGFDPALLAELGPYLVDPASPADVAAFEAAHEVRLPSRAKGFLELTDGMVDLRGLLGGDLTILPVSEWAPAAEEPRGYGGAGGSETFMVMFGHQDPWKGLDRSFLVGWDTDGEDEIDLRPPGVAGNSSWDVLHVQMPLDGTVTHHDDLQGAVDALVDQMREAGYHEPEIAEEAGDDERS